MFDAVIAVVIVNYQTPQLVISGLKSLEDERSNYKGIRVVIVDNASPDDSLELLKQAVVDNNWSSWVKLIIAPHNGGYAYGNNLGFTEVRKWLLTIDYFWMLNPDTKVLPGATAALIGHLQQNPNTIAGSCLQDHDGTKQISTFNFPSVIGELCAGFGLGILDRLFKNNVVCRAIPQQRETSDWMAGASLMFTDKVQRQLGDLDENFFLYYEEVDYLLRAKKQDIHCWYIPDSRVIHEVGAATGITNVRKQQPRRPTYWFESRRYYFLKNHGRATLLLADLVWLLGYSTWCLRKLVTAPADLKRQPPKLLRDFFVNSQFNPRHWGNSHKLTIGKISENH